MKNTEFIAAVLKRAGDRSRVDEQWNGVTAYEGRYGYVLGAQGELYTPELAEKWGKQKRAGKSYEYFTDACSVWFGKYVTDCSGLGVEAMRDFGTFTDRTANTFYAECTEKGPIRTIPNIPGVFVSKSGHIGYYLGDSKVCEDRGVDYGVVISDLDSQRWTNWGKHPAISFEAKPAAKATVTILGNSVNVRKEPSLSAATIGIAKKGETYAALDNGWRKIDFKGKVGYISAREDLTKQDGKV